MKEATTKKNIKSIRDNFSNGSVGDFLVDHIENNSNLSFVTAYFTIYAYEKLKPQLDNVKSLRLLFGEPRFIKSVASSTDAKNYQAVRRDRHRQRVHIRERGQGSEGAHRGRCRLQLRGDRPQGHC